MASNIPSSGWSVKIISLPASITIDQLAETFQLSTARICIPKIQKTITYFAWINDFVNEKDAKDFVDQWSNSHVFDTVIKCYVQGPKSGEAYVHHTRDNVSISHVKTADTRRPFNQHSQSNPVLPRPQPPSKLLYTNILKDRNFCRLTQISHLNCNRLI
jgi:hypothetical protein